MRTLIEARVAFSRSIGSLLGEISRRGLDFILDEGKRSPLQAHWNATHCRVMNAGVRCERTAEMHTGNMHAFKAIGIEASVHIQALAQDLLLIHGGQIVNEREAYEPLGNFWIGLDPMLRWGGNFSGFPDLGHFSHEWNGRA